MYKSSFPERLGVSYEGEIHAMSLVDNRRWRSRFFLDEEQNKNAAKNNPDTPAIKRADGIVEISEIQE